MCEPRVLYEAIPEMYNETMKPAIDEQVIELANK
jgi:hypothetical protein